MVIVFYNKDNTEGFLLDILSKHKIYDMDVRVEDTTIYLEDSFNTWVNDEVYDFFMNDLFVFTNDNKVPDLLTEEEFIAFGKLFGRTGVYPTDEGGMVASKRANRSFGAYRLPLYHWRRRGGASRRVYPWRCAGGGKLRGGEFYRAEKLHPLQRGQSAAF